MSLVRTLRSAEVTLTHKFYVGETLTDATGDVTCTTKRLDGTVVSGVPTTAGHPSTGTYTLVKPGYALVDAHIVTWTGTFGGSVTTVRDFVEVVGDFYFTIPELRALKPVLSVAEYPTEDLTIRRTQAEQECERITDLHFVRRFTRVKLNGTGTPYLPVPDLDPGLVRAAQIASRGGGTFSAVTGDSLNAIVCGPGYLVREDGGIWLRGHQNVIVEYEYGPDEAPVPEDLRDAVMVRTRNLAKGSTMGAIPDRTLSYSTPDGNVYRLTTPSAKKTGLPFVDAIYDGYASLAGGFA